MTRITTDRPQTINTHGTTYHLAPGVATPMPDEVAEYMLAEVPGTAREAHAPGITGAVKPPTKN